MNMSLRIQKLLALISLAIMLFFASNVSAMEELESLDQQQLPDDNSEKLKNLEEGQLDDPHYLPFPSVNPKRPREQNVRPMILNISYGMHSYFPAVASYGKEIFKLPYRIGMHFGPTIIMGGPGFGFELKVKFIYQHCFENWDDIYGPGINASIMYAWVHRWMVISTGLGIGASYLWGKKVVKVWEGVARIPVRLAWYPKEWIGLTIELGLSFGITAIEGPRIPALSRSDKNGAKGAMPGMDLSIGFQFP